MTLYYNKQPLHGTPGRFTRYDIKLTNFYAVRDVRDARFRTKGGLHWDASAAVEGFRQWRLIPDREVIDRLIAFSNAANMEMRRSYDTTLEPQRTLSVRTIQVTFYGAIIGVNTRMRKSSGETPDEASSDMFKPIDISGIPEGYELEVVSIPFPLPPNVDDDTDCAYFVKLFCDSFDAHDAMVMLRNAAQ